MSFNNKTKIAAKKMFGEEHEREMDHPLKQVGVRAANAGYNAMEAVNQIKDQLDPTSSRYHGNMPQGSSSMGASTPLPGVPDQSADFNSGSYANPSSTTDSGANSNSSSLSYDFMEDMNQGPQSQEQDPNKNKFGFWKRDAKSLQARIDDATERGKTAKVYRLQKKLDNFNKNQAARSGNYDPDTGSKFDKEGTGVGNFLRKINPKNWI